jgi:hypothetical protein
MYFAHSRGCLKKDAIDQIRRRKAGRIGEGMLEVWGFEEEGSGKGWVGGGRGPGVRFGEKRLKNWLIRLSETSTRSSLVKGER